MIVSCSLHRQIVGSYLNVGRLVDEAAPDLRADPQSLPQVKRLPVQPSSVYQLKWFSLFGRCRLFMSGGGEAWSKERLLPSMLGFKVWHR